MKLLEYQNKALDTCLPESYNYTYMFNNLVGEVGEFASKVAKAKRKGLLTVKHDDISFSKSPEHLTDVNMIKDALFLEVGDILWQLSGLCSVLGFSLDDVAVMNLNKLSKRKEVNTIDGEGDYR